MFFSFPFKVKSSFPFLWIIFPHEAKKSVWINRSQRSDEEHKNIAVGTKVKLYNPTYVTKAKHHFPWFTQSSQNFPGLSFFIYLVFVVVVVVETGSHYVSSGCPETHSVDQAVLEITEIPSSAALFL